MSVKKIKAYNIWIMIFAVFIFSAGFSVKAASDTDYPYVIDEPDMLSGSEYQSLYQKAERISSKYSAGIYLIILNDYEEYGFDIEDVADDIYYEYDLGYPSKDEDDGDNDGLVLILSMNDRDYDINAHGYLGNRAVNPAGKDYLRDCFAPDFKNNDWYNGLDHYLDGVEYLFGQEAAGTPYGGDSYGGSGQGDPDYEDEDSGFGSGTLIIVLISGLIGAFISVTSLRNMMLSVRSAESASGYVDGKLKLSANSDRYLYTTTQVIKRSQKSNSGGGSSRSGGGGSSHSSGKF